MKNGPHRPSKMVPNEYEFVFSYNGATTHDGWPIPPFGIDCTQRTHEEVEVGEDPNSLEHDKDGHCCVLGLLEAKKKVVGHTCTCTVCGTPFVYGEVWHHRPTDEYIHVGHICGHKYGLYMDREDFDRAYLRHRNMTIDKLEREFRLEWACDFCKQYEGLQAAFDRREEHHIIEDIWCRLVQYGSISEKQIAFVLKLVKELDAPPENYVQAPTGKGIEFEGEVVGLKWVQGFHSYRSWDQTAKITVKVTQPDGVWLVYGTCPRALLEKEGEVKGSVVKLKANLESGKDKHFVFMNRPRLA